MFEEKIKYAWCLDEKMEEETTEGILLDCLEDCYTPERGMQFISETGREKEFYV